MLSDAALARSCADFARAHGVLPRVFRAPGRINLIGEHTDYNAGWVLPCAIDRALVALVAARPDRIVRVTSAALGQTQAFALDALTDAPSGTWLDHVRGVARGLCARGVQLGGAELWIDGDLALGAGLGSSAALGIGSALALCAASGVALAPRALAEVVLAAEHDDVGTRCGPMDPLCVVLARAQHALLLDCRSLEIEHVPLELGTAQWLVCDTGVKHALATSAYNERRAQCEQALDLLARHTPGMHALRDAREADLAQLPPLLQARARHVLRENERVLQACAALRAGDVAQLGRLMLASHASLRDDYAVSCAELDLLVDAAAVLPGVHGARMTGGGFGGCAIVLVDAASRTRVRQALARTFLHAFGRPVSCDVVQASAAAGEIAAPTIEPER